MKKTYTYGIIGLFLVGILAANAFATPFGEFGMIKFFDKNQTMKQALDDNNYEGYMTALENNYQAYKASITQDKFNKMVEQKNHMEELRANMTAKMNEIKQALNDKDYDAWTQAIAGTPEEEVLSELITEDNFDRFVELHEALENKDFETAKDIAQELGLPQKPMQQPRHRQIFNQMRD